MADSEQVSVTCPQHDVELDGLRETFRHYLLEHGTIATLRGLR